MSLAPSFIANTAVRQMFAAMETVVEKGAAAAKDKNVEDSVYLNWRFAPDMFPFAFQVRVGTELAARGLSRLAGAELPSFVNDETTFAELLQRIEKTRRHIDALSPQAIDADPEGAITVPMRDEEVTFKRHDYLLTFIVPNLYFHTSAAYLILRHLGVDLGKRDFLASASSK